jgi:hypothetical protein
MCTVTIETVVGVNSNGDNEREAIVVVGTVKDCSGLKVALFNTFRQPMEPGDDAGLHFLLPLSHFSSRRPDWLAEHLGWTVQEKHSNRLPTPDAR